MLRRLLRAPFPADHRWHAPLVLLICAAVYWPLLGGPGFGATEGHRVAPAWRMLETGEYWRIELFEQPYLRKPPGMPWAIAAFSSILGEAEFAARAVSAAACTLMALVALAFGNRWFGRPYGLGAGVAQALTPLFILAGRVAEIDALNALGTQLTTLAILDMLLRPPHASAPGRGAGGLMLLVASAGVCVAALAKGPASLSVVVALLGGTALATRSIRVLLHPGLPVIAGVASAVLTPIAFRLLEASGGNGAVTQDFSEFTWASADLRKLLRMPIAAFMAAWPTSWVIVFPFGPDSRREATAGAEGPPDRGTVAARSLARAWLLNLALLLAMGVSNPRYAMPGAVLLPPLLGYLARGMSRAGVRGAFTPVRRLIARAITLWFPPVYPLILLVMAAVWIPLSAGRASRSEGRAAGTSLATLLPNGAEVWAGDLVEARPDVLLYAERTGAGRVRPRWMRSELQAGELPDVTGGPRFLLLRADSESGEQERYRGQIENGRLVERGRWRVAKYDFGLFQVIGKEAGAESPGR